MAFLVEKYRVFTLWEDRDNANAEKNEIYPHFDIATEQIAFKSLYEITQSRIIHLAKVGWATDAEKEWTIVKKSVFRLDVVALS